MRNSAELVDAVNELAQALRCWQQDERLCGELTFSQFNILRAVEEAEQLSSKGLSDALGVEKSTTTRLVAPLVKRGLLSRRSSGDDKRVSFLTITNKGEKAMKSVESCQQQIWQTFTRSVPAAQRENIMNSLQTFSQAIKGCCQGSACC